MATRPGWRQLSALGLLLGALFFAASLTPSLIPRGFVLQGILGGIAFAAGYGIAQLLRSLWTYLELPLPHGRSHRILLTVAGLAAAAIVVGFLALAAGWQNSIRERMGMPPVTGARPLEVGAIALLTALALLLLGRVVAGTFGVVLRRFDRILPPRPARLLAVAATLLLFWLLIDGVLARSAIRMIDRSAQALDEVLQPELDPPAEGDRVGSPASLVGWDSLGRTGRDYVSSGPSRADIADFLGAETPEGKNALMPLRVYVGLNSADSAEERAALALEELIRVGGFERSVLVIGVPTGTGWMDPTAVDTLEYLHRGDVATVSMQYSYLLSWISLLVQPTYSKDAGRALFSAVYNHWHELPRESRPRLYLYGLSLGAYASQESLSPYQILGDPPQGALWVGPPFNSSDWREATNRRQPDSPAWRPLVGEGALVRFTNHGEGLDLDGAPWGPMRVVFLQYASDPITFFEPESLFRAPAWMIPPVGQDVSPKLHWIPVVTFLQLMLDMGISLNVPMGHGHLYSWSDHIEPWIAVTEPEGWTQPELDRLDAHLSP